MITPSEATETGPEAAESNSHDEGSEHCVPLALLALEGTKPAVGDAVEYTVAGKVQRIEGDKAYILAETINGEPLPKTATPADEDAALLKEASAADAEAEKAYA